MRKTNTANVQGKQMHTWGVGDLGILSKPWITRGFLNSL